MTQHDDYLIRPMDHARLRDRDRIVRLLTEYLDSIGASDSALERYRWLYLGNPHGEAITFGAYPRRNESAGPVAMTSLFPRHVVVAGRQRRGAIGGDAYVRPEHRRRGIATALHREALAAMSSGRVEFMYGPPEPRNLDALRKAGSVVTGRVRRYVRPMSLRAWTQLSVGKLPLARAGDLLFKPHSAHVELHPVGSWRDRMVDRAFERLVADVSMARRVVPVRDSAYVAWRYASSPSHIQRAFVLMAEDEPVGFVSIERAGGRCAIVDFWSTLDQRSDALRAVVNHCQPADIVDFQAYETRRRPALYLTSLGFVPRGREKLFQVQTPPETPNRALLSGQAPWLYTRGDGDVDHVLV